MKHNVVKAYWWRYDYPNKLNFGDEITPILLERLFGRIPQWADWDECELIAVGSIIETAQRRSGDRPIKVWGSGFIQAGPANTKTNLDFYAVRGKLSQKRILTKHPIVLGDPALLLPLVIEPSQSKKHKIGIVPHYVDHESLVIRQFLLNNSNVTFINVLDPVKQVVKDITSCELILSSSLHGLVIADAYGIPNARLVLSDKIIGGDYKFDDYNSVFTRKDSPPVIHGSQLLECDLPLLIEKYSPVSNDLAALQEKLIAALPAK